MDKKGKSKSDITYHNKDMRQVEGNVYCGEPKAESQWNSYCMLYVLYPEQKVAMEIGAVNADYDTAEAANVATRNGIETQDAFINTIKRKIEAQEHIQLSWIEYLKYIRPTLIDACWESRKALQIDVNRSGSNGNHKKKQRTKHFWKRNRPKWKS